MSEQDATVASVRPTLFMIKTIYARSSGVAAVPLTFSAELIEKFSNL